jgi:hypothetical protein
MVPAGHRAKAEVSRVVVEEHPEPAWPVRPHATAHDGAGERDRLVVPLLEREQAGPVASGVVAGEVADLEACTHTDTALASCGLPVSATNMAYTSTRTRSSGARRPPYHAPEIVLVAGLTNHVEVDTASQSWTSMPSRIQVGR